MTKICGAINSFAQTLEIRSALLFQNIAFRSVFYFVTFFFLFWLLCCEMWHAFDEVIIVAFNRSSLILLVVVIVIVICLRQEGFFAQSKTNYIYFYSITVRECEICVRYLRVRMCEREALYLPVESLFNSSSINAWINSLHVVALVTPDMYLGSPHIQIGISSTLYSSCVCSQETIIVMKKKWVECI